MDAASQLAWHIAFIATALCGGSYFLFRRRRFDFFSLAFLGACFYFLPGFLGFAGYAEGFILTPVPIVGEAYATMCWVMGVILLCGILSDAMANDGAQSSSPLFSGGSDPFRYTGAIATLAGAAGLALTMITVGSDLLDPDKVALLENLNRWYLLWTTGAVLGLAITFLRGSYALFAVNFLLLLANLYVGFRVDLVIAVLAVGAVVLNSRGHARLARHWKIGVLTAIFGLALFAYKYVQFALKALDVGLLASQIRNPEALRLIFLYSEPFVVQGTLNEVVRQHFFVGAGHLQALITLLVPFANELGAEVAGFNDLFQPALFSSVTGYGLGNNIWAEMWAVGGWVAVLIFSLGYCYLLFACGRALARAGPELRGLIAVLGVYWAFYIHRNDLLYQLTLSRRMLLAWLAFVLASVLLNMLRGKLNVLGANSRVLSEGGS